jgi:acetyl-CoA carboxylase biotin carboxyl carrier protein
LPLTYKEVAEILKIIDASDCEELVVELDGAKLVVRRHGGAGAARAEYSDGGTRRSGTADDFAAEPAAPGAAEPGHAEPTRTGEPAHADGRILVRSPMVGTFYRRPGPQDPPFVEVGDSVAPGDPLCLIEVMKLFTTIEAEHAGRVVEIGAEDDSPVEHDQILFVIEPS